MSFSMRAALPASLALAASITAAAAEGQSPKDDQAVAAMIEWAVANCGMNTVSPLHAMMAQMITNGTDPAEMARVREMVRGKITASFATTEAACTSITAHIAGRG
jgi:alkylation response protein AidB-like acyl-CoA dehydrogenase